jgi:hypothetical protein
MNRGKNVTDSKNRRGLLVPLLSEVFISKLILAVSFEHPPVQIRL